LSAVGEYGGANASIENSVTFTVLDADTLPAIFQGKLGPENESEQQGGCYLYGRSFSPTVRHLGRQLAALEGTEAAYACASGMSAISGTLLSLCSTGDHIIASNAIYGGTHALLKDFLPQKCNITTTFVDITNHEEVKQAILPCKTKVIYTESLSNPTLVVADIPSLAHIARSNSLKLVVDNTFSPMILSPARLGADIVLHSLTKFVSGASDVIGGAICGSAAFIRGLMDLHCGPLMLLGPVMDPKVASELSLRLPHLGLRVAEHSRRALAFAQRLYNLGARITYPGLPTHPQYQLLCNMMNPGEYGFGGLLTLELDSLSRAHRFMEYLQNESGFGLMAVSLGYFDTLMSASAASTSSELTGVELKKAGINSGLVRLSVGLTGSLEQRWTQLEEAYTWINSFDIESIQDVEMKMKREEGGALVKGKGKLQQPSWPVIRSAAAAAGGGGGHHLGKWHNGGSRDDNGNTIAPAIAGIVGRVTTGNGSAPSVPASDFSEGTDEEDVGDALVNEDKVEMLE
jgi:methionine-gamma-lyase